MKKAAIFLLASVVYLTSCKTTSEAVNLKLQMPKGSQYEYTTAMDMNMTQNFQGQEMKMTNKYHFLIAFAFSCFNVIPSGSWGALYLAFDLLFSIRVKDS